MQSSAGVGQVKVGDRFKMGLSSSVHGRSPFSSSWPALQPQSSNQCNYHGLPTWMLGQGRDREGEIGRRGKNGDIGRGRGGGGYETER